MGTLAPHRLIQAYQDALSENGSETIETEALINLFATRVVGLP